MCENTYVNIQIGEVLDIDKVAKLKNNTMLKVKPELWYEWDFKKNNELGLDIYKVTKGSKKKAWWICKVDHDHRWDASIGSRVNLSSGCPYCSGRRATENDNLLINNPELCEEWDYEHNKLTPEKYKSKSNRMVSWICKKCKEGFNMSISNRTKGSGCPYCSGQKVNKNNCLSTKNPELASEWHPTLNNGLTPLDVTCGASEKVWWLCDKGHEWKSSIYSRSYGHGCPFCVNLKIDKSNSLFTIKPKVAKYWHETKNGDLTPHNVSCGSGQKVWWKCDCGKDYEMTVVHRVKTSACPNCTQFIFMASKGVDDMWTTNPDLASLLANPEDGYKYTQSSGKKVDWKCPDCGEIIKDKKISHIKNRMFKCHICNDGMSFPERIIYNLLLKLNLDFIHDKTITWSFDRRYDFYLPFYNTIIEIHGKQHYKEMFKNIGGRTLEEEQENDRLKEKLAKENGIEHYIVIDARHSDFEYIKINIMKSTIGKLFDIDSIDWDKINKKSQSSLLFKICDLWNEGCSIKKISNELSKDRNTITKYLKVANTLSFVDYSIEESMERGYLDSNKNFRPIVQLTLDKQFIKEYKSISDAVKEVEINRTSISMCCSGKRNIAGNFLWMYLEDYKKHMQ